MSRGEIKHIARSQQVNSFKNMKYGKITPTDLDALIEYKDKAYIFIEVKHRNAVLPFGQKLALERLVKDTSPKKHSIAIVCEHYQDDTDKQVDLASCTVRELYLSSENYWRPPSHHMEVKQLTNLFIHNIVEKNF